MPRLSSPAAKLLRGVGAVPVGPAAAVELLLREAGAELKAGTPGHRGISTAMRSCCASGSCAISGCVHLTA